MIIEECLEFLAPQKWKKALTWPPDAFALCAYLLQKSGSYVNVVSQWPPPGPAKTQSEWVERIRKIGQQWKNSPQEPPIEVKRWWGMLLRNKRADLLKLSDKKRTRQGQLLLWEALTCICAAADECCRGIGLPGGSDPIDVAVRELFMLQMMAVGRISTLCRDVDASKVCILPKLHTPRTGITMRSLSHNLSFFGDWRGMACLVTDGTDRNASARNSAQPAPRSLAEFDHSHTVLPSAIRSPSAGKHAGGIRFFSITRSAVAVRVGQRLSSSGFCARRPQRWTASTG